MDKRRAEKLKRSYLEQLALENALSLTDKLASAILTDPVLSREAAIATYGAELLRRCHKTGSPIRDFELHASAILEAERRLINALSAAA
jgi:hypothetical protein